MKRYPERSRNMKQTKVSDYLQQCHIYLKDFQNEHDKHNKISNNSNKYPKPPSNNFCRNQLSETPHWASYTDAPGRMWFCNALEDKRLSYIPN